VIKLISCPKISASIFMVLCCLFSEHIVDGFKLVLFSHNNSKSNSIGFTNLGTYPHKQVKLHFNHDDEFLWHLIFHCKFVCKCIFTHTLALTYGSFFMVQLVAILMRICYGEWCSNPFCNTQFKLCYSLNHLHVS
jgi:hypothetical protein